MLSKRLLALAFLFAVLFAALPSFSVADSDAVELDLSTDAEADATTPDVSVEEVDEYEEVEEVEVEEAPPQMYVLPADDVLTTVKLLGVEDNKFIAGEEVTALIGVSNSGDKTYNFSYVGAHLHSPFDTNFYVQNFTVRWISQLLPPRSEATIEYRFRPDEKLEPLDFHFSGWLIYNDSATVPIIYRSLFLNQTVEVLERRAHWTVQSVLTYALVLGGAAIAAYVALQQGALGKKVARRTAVADPVASGAWDTKVYQPAKVQRAAGGSKKAAKKQ